MQYTNQLTGKTVHFFIGETVYYLDNEQGTVISDTNVLLKDGTIVKSLRTQTHKFSLKYKISLIFRMIGIRY